MALPLKLNHLDYIFKFLKPHEWLVVSKVCKLWKKAASRQWKRITEISYPNIGLEREEEERRSATAPVITFETCTEMAIHAIKFVQVFKDSSSYNEKQKFVLFGCFWYNVQKFNSEKMLKLMAENTTELTEVHFDTPPRLETIKLIFKNNKKINDLEVFESNGFYDEIPTEGIEKLFLRFIDPDQVSDFEGLFPNLKELTLTTDCAWVRDPERILPMILPYVRQIKSFSLNVILYEHYSASHKILWEIVKFTQLEELSIWLEEMEIKSVEPFINKLVLMCHKLRTVALSGFNVNESALQSLMLLRNLESLEASPTGFGDMELPEMTNLTKLDLSFTRSSTVRITHLCKALEKMPKLERLKISGLNEKQALKLTCQAITVAASQKNDVVLNRLEWDRGYRKLKIEGQNGEKTQTLNLTIDSYDEKTYFDDVKTFVEKKVKNYRAFVFEDEEEKKKYQVKGKVRGWVPIEGE